MTTDLLYLTENPVEPGRYLHIEGGHISHWVLVSEIPEGAFDCSVCGQPNGQTGYVRAPGTQCAHRGCVRITQAVEI